MEDEEGVVHALRHAHELLVPDGTMLDLHPVTEGRIETQGVAIGVVPEPEFVETDLPNVETALKRVVAEGRYSPEAETSLDVLQHFDTAEELLERHAEHLHGEDALVARIRSATPPFVVREHAVLRRLRALHPAGVVGPSPRLS
jgi:hypothetical protein